jgi:hypothetical protein
MSIVTYWVHHRFDRYQGTVRVRAGSDVWPNNPSEDRSVARFRTQPQKFSVRFVPWLGTVAPFFDNRLTYFLGFRINQKSSHPIRLANSA